MLEGVIRDLGLRGYKKERFELYNIYDFHFPMYLYYIDMDEDYYDNKESSCQARWAVQEHLKF